MTDFANPVDGPVAFGTSARSAVLTNWPGGGFVGVHGTNELRSCPAGCARLHPQAERCDPEACTHDPSWDDVDGPVGRSLGVSVRSAR